MPSRLRHYDKRNHFTETLVDPMSSEPLGRCLLLLIPKGQTHLQDLPLSHLGYCYTEVCVPIATLSDISPAPSVLSNRETDLVYFKVI